MYDRLAGATTINWPSSIEPTDQLTTSIENIISTTSLGPTPISQKSLVSNVCEYLKIQYNILRANESHNIIATTDLATEVTPFWIYQHLQSFESFTTIPKKHRQKIARYYRHLINNDHQTPDLNITIPDNVKNHMLQVVADTRQRINNSKSAKTDHSIPLDSCFAPKRSDMEPSIRLFALLPTRSFNKPYVDITIHTLRPLINQSLDRGRPKVKVSKNLGIGRIKDDCATFYDIFKFERVGMRKW
jgi:hypothetical protein